MTKSGVQVKLIGLDGNAFSIIGRVMKALRGAGHFDLAEDYWKEAQAGDYNNLLRVTMEYVEVE